MIYVYYVDYFRQRITTVSMYIYIYFIQIIDVGWVIYIYRLAYCMHSRIIAIMDKTIVMIYGGIILYMKYNNITIHMINIYYILILKLI